MNIHDYFTITYQVVWITVGLLAIVALIRYIKYMG